MVARASATHGNGAGVALPSAPGNVVPVGGRRVHTMTAGAASATTGVLLESALGCPCSEWVIVQAQLAQDGIRSIAYDRPGVGWSPAADRADTPDEHAHHLSALLEALKCDRVVLVGHSVGGLLARSFWLRHSEKVAAIVLVDASHPDQHLRSSRQREGFRALQAQLRAARRRPASLTLTGDVASLPSPYDELTHIAATVPAAIKTALAELKAWLGAWDRDAARANDLGELPVTVLTAGESVVRDPAHRVLQRELLALSASARHVVYEGATHQGIVMDERFATQVAAEISDVFRRS